MTRFFVAALLTVVVCTDALAQIGLRTARAKSRAEPQNAQPPQITMERADSDLTEDSDECTVPEGFWPTRNNANNTLCLFNHEDGEQEYAKYARFFRTSKTTSATADLVNDALGGLYISFSAAVAANTDDDEEEGDGPAVTVAETDDEASAGEDKTLNLLRANGGNLALTASLPIYYKPFVTDDAPDDDDPGRGSFLWNSYLRLAANLDAMGGDTNEASVAEDEINGNLELAFTELQVDLLSFQRKFNLLGYLRTSAVVGTDKWAEALGEDVSRTFLHGQVGAGVRIAENASIYFTYNWYSDDDVPGNGGTFMFVIGD